MSTLKIRRAIEKHLALMTPEIDTAYENVDFTPHTNTPYQQVNLLPSQPDNSSQGSGHFIEVGLMQVMLCYPLNGGTSDIQARAEAVKAHFQRGTTLTEDGLSVLIKNTPTISPGFRDSDRYKIPINIYYHADVFN